MSAVQHAQTTQHVHAVAEYLAHRPHDGKKIDFADVLKTRHVWSSHGHHHQHHHFSPIREWQRLKFQSEEPSLKHISLECALAGNGHLNRK